MVCLMDRTIVENRISPLFVLFAPRKGRIQDSPVRAILVIARCLDFARCFDFARCLAPTTGRIQDSPVRPSGPRARKLRKPCKPAARSDLKTRIPRLQKHPGAGLEDSRIGETPHGPTEKRPGTPEEATSCRRLFLGWKMYPLAGGSLRRNPPLPDDLFQGGKSASAPDHVTCPCPRRQSF